MNQYEYPPARAQIGNFNGATQQASGTSGLVPAPASGDAEKYLKGNGVWGTVPTEVNEYASESAFPATGSAGVLYIAKDTNEIFRWDDTEGEYVAISSAGGETALHKVVFSIATTDWTATTGGYTASVTDVNITTDSEEIVIYDDSIGNLTSNIGYTKATGAITFFVESLPTGAVGGRILIIGGSIAYDSKLNKNQGAANAGKVMKVGLTGELTPETIATLPAVTSADNGKIMTVVNGAWAAASMTAWQGGNY